MNKTENNPVSKTASPYQNRVVIVGFLGNAPEVREGHVCLSIATKTSWLPKDSTERKSKTEWHRVTVWGAHAAAVAALAKGDHVLAEGSLRSSEYEREVKLGKKTVKVKTRTWEVRAYGVRKLERNRVEVPSETA